MVMQQRKFNSDSDDGPSTPSSSHSLLPNHLHGSKTSDDEEKIRIMDESNAMQFLGDTHPLTALTSKPQFVISTFEVVLLVGCVLSMVIQTEVASILQLKLNYQKPYFILWTSHVSFALILPLQLCYFRCRHGPLRLHLKYMYSKLKDAFPGSTFQFIKRAYLMICLGTLAAYLWYGALNFTTVAKLTTLYNTSPFFAFFFSILFHIDHEKWHPRKFMALLFSFVGVMFITLIAPNPTDSSSTSGPILTPPPPAPSSSSSSSSSPTSLLPSFSDPMLTSSSSFSNPSHWIGDGLGLLNAMVFGLYEALYKKYLAPSPPNIAFTNYVTALLGVLNFFGLWPPIVVLHLLGIETFVVPDLVQTIYILVISLLGLIFNFCFLLLLAVTTPVWAATAIVLTIPCSNLADWLLGNITFITWNTYVGTFLICFGFYLLTSSRLLK